MIDRHITANIPPERNALELDRVVWSDGCDLQSAFAEQKGARRNLHYLCIARQLEVDLGVGPRLQQSIWVRGVKFDQQGARTHEIEKAQALLVSESR
jgi:hypothetical protein